MERVEITSNPAVMMGQPVVAATHITVELILEKMAAGETAEQILEAHPRLTPDSTRAALGFAAAGLRADVVYPIENLAGRTVLGQSLTFNALLITADKDFGELVFRQRSLHAGIDCSDLRTLLRHVRRKSPPPFLEPTAISSVASSLSSRSVRSASEISIQTN
jgi:uncharacterized protein (DUF433 family)